MASKDRMIFQTEETRQLILDSAWTIFLEKGFFDAQMKDVAEATGLSRTSLYRYFQDKTDLAMALVGRATAGKADERHFLSDRDENDRPTPVPDRIASLLRERWLSPRRRDDYIFLAEFDAYFSGSRVPRDFKKKVSASILGQGGEDVLTRLIEEGIGDGSLRADLDPHLTMVTLVNAVRGLQQRLILRGGTLIETKAGELERMPEALVTFLIDGIRSTSRRN